MSSKFVIVHLLALVFKLSAASVLPVQEQELVKDDVDYFQPRERREVQQSTGCGGSYKVHHGDINIVSPTYESELDCLWTLISGASCLPEIICKDIDLRPDNCEEEFLRISDGVGGDLKLCGSAKDTYPPRRSSNKGRDLFITFKTSTSDKFDRTYKGFTCYVSCAKDLKKVTSQKLPFDNLYLKENSGCICGTKKGLADRIVGGEDAKQNEFPWQAAIVKPKTRNPVCGGTVINSKWILTAAHCFWFKNSQPPDFQVLLHAHLLNFQLLKGHDKTAALGEMGSIKGSGWDLEQKTDKDEKSIRFNILEIINHPLFTDKYDYDVALVRVNGTIPMVGEDKPVPICLPPLGAYRVSFDGVHAMVSGWGLPHEDAGSSTRMLQKLYVPIIKMPECQAKMPSHVLTRRMLCAGFLEGLKDACKGDSGGPLVAKLTKSQYTQIGIVSWGEGCARKNRPGIYSRLTELIQWVLFHTRYSGAAWCKTSMAQ